MYFFNVLYDYVFWFRGRVYGVVVERLVMFSIDKIKLKDLSGRIVFFFFFCGLKIIFIL